MPRNTVLENAANDVRSKVVELELLLKNEANSGKCILVLEGPDDQLFYAKYVDNKNVIFSIAKGCYYMPELLSQSQQNTVLKDCVIGIKDADFDHVLGKEYGLDNLFLTDTHDWETMTMTEDGEIAVACEALGKTEEGLFLRVMSDIAIYSYIRLYNLVEICEKSLDGILFRDFSFPQIYDGNNLSELSTCIECLKRHGNNASLSFFPSVESVREFVERCPKYDLYQISCGHDIIHGIICRLSFILGHSPEIGHRDIPRILRAAYTKQRFMATRLFVSIETWAKGHGKIVWAA